MLIYIKGAVSNLVALKWKKEWSLLTKDAIWINYAKIHHRNQKTLHQNKNKVLEQQLPQ